MSTGAWRWHAPIHKYIYLVTIRSDSMLESTFVWVDGRNGSQAKTKTKHGMQLKLTGHDLWHIDSHFDMKK